MARDGHRFIVDSRQVLYEGETRSPACILTISRDITKRKEMEEDLRQSEAQFRTLANAIPNLCAMANPDGSFFWLNQRWSDYTGLTLEQSEGSGWLSAIDRDASSAAVEMFDHSMAAGEPFESVFEVRGADSVCRPFLARGVPLRDRAGKVVRWFGTMTDISEQRRTEDALRKAHSELQAVMDAMSVGLLISRDPECRSVLGNRRAYQLLHETPGSNLSVTSAAFRLMEDGKEIPPRDLPLQKAAATGQAVYDRELQVAFPDGSRADFIENIVPLLDSGGRSTGAVGVFVDITERKRTEQRLRQAQKLESIGLLAGGIAHDFNNLLTVIIGNADFARTKYPSIEELQHIIAASERAAHLTSQLLAYAGKGQFISKPSVSKTSWPARRSFCQLPFPRQWSLALICHPKNCSSKAIPARSTRSS